MHWQRTVWLLAMACMFSGASYTMLTPFLPLYLLEIGVTTEEVHWWTGFIFSITFFVAAVMAPYWGRRADRSGKRRMVLRAGFSLAAVYFLGAFVRNPWELLAVRLLQGFANGFVPASLAIVASASPPERLGSNLGFMQTALLLGGIAGPLAGGALSHVFGMRMSFVVAAAVIFIGTLAVAAWVKEPPQASASRQGSVLDDFREAWNNKTLMRMLFLMFGVQVVTLVLQPLLALFVAELQGDLEGVALTAGIVCSVAGIAGAVAAPLWGRVGQKKGFALILQIAFLGAAVWNALQFFAVDIVQFSLLQALFGFFVVGVFPAINTIAVQSSNENFRGRLFGLTTTANQLGCMTGPLLGGFISASWGIRPVFLLTASLLLFLALLSRNGKICRQH